MNPDALDQRLQELRDTIRRSPSVADDVMRRIRQTPNAPARPARSRRFRIMHSRTFKWLVSAAAAAAAIAVVVTFVRTGSKPAYAWEQTLAAMQGVRFVHMIWRGADGTLHDERWIEIGPDGVQVRYRQEGQHAKLNWNALIVQNGDTVMDWQKDKNTVILWNAKEKTYVFVSNWRELFADLAGKGVTTIQENVGYKGRPAHHVRWSHSSMDCYVDPVTKLPIAVGPYELSYEDPPAGTFDIVLPKGVPVLDKRPGAAPTPDPEWMKNEDAAHKEREEGIRAMLQGDHARAVDLFTQAVALEPRENWTWFYLGRERHRLGQYDEAIKNYDHVFEMFAMLKGIADELKMHGIVPYYCYLARGLAYRAKGLEEQAKADFGIALPIMIDSLRHPDGTSSFDDADGLRGDKGTETERVLRMMKRLREVTGQTFGFDPAGPAEAREAAVAAWENWWKAHKADYPASDQK